MKNTLQRRFVKNYVLMFFISTVIAAAALYLLNFSTYLLEGTLVKNKYTAQSLMQPDYAAIHSTPVVQNGGGLQVVNAAYDVVRSDGLFTLPAMEMTAAQFTEFLVGSRQPGVAYGYSIAYNEAGKFWLIVSFPTSIRIDFNIVHNTEYPSVDTAAVAGFAVVILGMYLIMLALSTALYAKLTAQYFIRPLGKLRESAQRLRSGAYQERVKLHLRDEFGELEDAFNDMAAAVEREISLREQSEKIRRQLVLDISHDLKNPLAAVMGYAEYCKNHPDIARDQRDACLRVIYDNSCRANALLSGLFELSKLESPGFALNTVQTDICEYLRKKAGEAISRLDAEGFLYAFDIPEQELSVLLDAAQMDRVFHNLLENALLYNRPGTEVSLTLTGNAQEVALIFADDGRGMPQELALEAFEPFARADKARNFQTGGTGLGLAIVKKIVEMHGGSIALTTEKNKGCKFTIRLPRYII